MYLCRWLDYTGMRLVLFVPDWLILRNSHTLTPDFEKFHTNSFYPIVRYTRDRVVIRVCNLPIARILLSYLK